MPPRDFASGRNPCGGKKGWKDPSTCYVKEIPALSKMMYKKVNKFGVIPPHVQNVSDASKGNMLFYARQIISCSSLYISKDCVNNELIFMFFNRVLHYERFN